MSRMQFRNAALEGRLLPVVQMREVETTDSLSMLHGLAVPYREWASIGWFLESFAPGSLAKSIREAGRALPLNIFHQDNVFPIGSASEWKDGQDALRGVWALDSSELAQEAARLAKAGHMTGLSIEFQPIRSEWEEAHDWAPELGPEHMDRVTRKEARLGAVGLVQTPAYVSAGVELVRSADARQRAAKVEGTPVLDAMKRATEALRRG